MSQPAFSRHLGVLRDAGLALTDPEHLAAWFPTTVDGDAVPGPPLRFSFRDMQMPDFDGTMVAFDPPKPLEFVWGDERLRFELTPDSRGTTLRFSASLLSSAGPRGMGLAGMPASACSA
jgi:uncharacterized protein YndB with AHSA1/START domain